MCFPDHPDIANALRTGYPSNVSEENQDSEENRSEFIADHTKELVHWLRMGYPEILDEFIEFSGQVCRISYRDWLN